MKGSITIRVTEHGYGIDLDLEDVDLQGKCELVHTMFTVLEMSSEEKALFFMADKMGILDGAASQRTCTTEEELDSLLAGGKVNEG